jgi:hypothetical protein
MTNVNIELDSLSIERSCKGEQICFVHPEQQGMVGDIFSLDFNKKLHYFKILDIWLSPSDFITKFLWRMCGLKSISELNDQIKEEPEVTMFAHFYAPCEEIKNLVKS